MAYQIEKHVVANEQNEMVFHRGWIVDYVQEEVSAIEVTFENQIHAAQRKLNLEEVRHMKKALDTNPSGSCTASKGNWIQSNPVELGTRTGVYQVPDRVRVIGGELSVRVSPKYNSEKIGGGVLESKTRVDAGEKLTPLEHQQEVYESIVINFYRVSVLVSGKEQQGWLLDYSPGKRRRTLEIMYNKTPLGFPRYV